MTDKPTLFTGIPPQEPKNPCEGCNARDGITCIEIDSCMRRRAYSARLGMYQSFNLKPVDIKKLARSLYESLKQAKFEYGILTSEKVEYAISQYIGGE
jgi:hypothetical protein